MYILTSALLKKGDKYYLKLEVRVVCREFLAYKYTLRIFEVHLE